MSSSRKVTGILCLEYAFLQLSLCSQFNARNDEVITPAQAGAQAGKDEPSKMVPEDPYLRQILHLRSQIFSDAKTDSNDTNKYVQVFESLSGCGGAEVCIHELGLLPHATLCRDRHAFLRGKPCPRASWAADCRLLSLSPGSVAASL